MPREVPGPRLKDNTVSFRVQSAALEVMRRGHGAAKTALCCYLSSLRYRRAALAYRRGTRCATSKGGLSQPFDRAGRAHRMGRAPLEEIRERLRLGVVHIGPWEFLALAALYPVSGSLTISRTLRVPNP